MATEVELFEYRDIASRPGIRGYIDANGAAQLALGDYTAARFVTVNGIQYLVDEGGNPLVQNGLIGPTYVNRSVTDKFVVNGAETPYSRATMSIHDINAYRGSLRNALTGKSNPELFQDGQQLVAIPGAVSAPYWTDPGAVTLSRGADNIPDQLSPHLVYEDGAWVFRSVEGYGDASNGKRRVQVGFDKIRARRRMVWDLSFMVPDEDDAPYSASPAFKYPFLVWQLKGANDPFAAMSIETQEDGTYNLYWYQKWSCDASDVSTYSRQINSSSTGVVTAQAQSVRFFQKTFTKGEWLDIVIESYLDERDITTAAGGFGYTNVWINNEQVLAYSGPTLSYRDTAGATPPPHAWYIGVYRHQSGAPAGLEEYDLDRQADPAPYTRVVKFRRARLMDLGEAFSAPTNSQPLVDVWANRATLATAGNTLVYFSDVGVGGSMWRYSGGRWRPVGGSVLLDNLITAQSTQATSLAVIRATTILPGLLQDGDFLEWDAYWTKEGGTSETATVDCRLGASAVSTGTSLGLSTTSLATTQQQMAMRHRERRISATSVQRGSIIGSSGVGVATAAPAVVTVPDMDSQTMYLQMLGNVSAGSESLNLRYFNVRLVAGA